MSVTPATIQICSLSPARSSSNTPDHAQRFRIDAAGDSNLSLGVQPESFHAVRRLLLAYPALCGVARPRCLLANASVTRTGSNSRPRRSPDPAILVVLPAPLKHLIGVHSVRPRHPCHPCHRSPAPTSFRRSAVSPLPPTAVGGLSLTNRPLRVSTYPKWTLPCAHFGIIPTYHTPSRRSR